MLSFYLDKNKSVVYICISVCNVVCGCLCNILNSKTDVDEANLVSGPSKGDRCTNFVIIVYMAS